MQRLLWFTWLAACASGATDGVMPAAEMDFGVEEEGTAEDGEDVDDAQCNAVMSLPCPAGYGFQMFRGTGHQDLDVIDLATVGEPVCGGTYVSSASLEGVSLVGFHVVQNSACTYGCFGGCPFWGACFVESSDGEIACLDECRPMDADVCAAFVQGCLGASDCD